jgi:hypothetical protein
MIGNDVPLLIFGGAPRCRKTTLAGKLARSKGISHLPLDSFVFALQESHPELGICHLSGKDWDVCDRLEPILLQQLRWMHDYEIPVVLDTFHIRPQTVIKLRNEIPLRAVFLGYPRDSVEDRFQMVRANEKPSDWTKDWTDAQVRGYLQGFIQASIDLERACHAVDLPFFDVSHNSEEGYDQAYQMLAGEG